MAGVTVVVNSFRPLAGVRLSAIASQHRSHISVVHISVHISAMYTSAIFRAKMVVNFFK